MKMAASTLSKGSVVACTVAAGKRERTFWKRTFPNDFSEAIVSRAKASRKPLATKGGSFNPAARGDGNEKAVFHFVSDILGQRGKHAKVGGLHVA